MTITTQMIDQQIKKMPNCWLAKNIAEFQLDYKSVPTQLIESFYFNFSEEPKEHTLEYWNNLKNVHKELLEKGLFNIKVVNHQKLIEAFKQEVYSSECKIKQSDIDEICTLKTRKGHTTIHFEYNDFMHLFDEAYGLDNRDFFGKFGKNRAKFENELYKRYLGVSYEEIQKASKLAPKESLLALKMSIITKYTLDQNIYFDFWHKLIDRDFAEVSNGSMQTMFLSEEDVEDFDSSEDDKFVGEYELYSLIKQAIFKELKTSFDKNGLTLEDSIDFYVWW